MAGCAQIDEPRVFATDGDAVVLEWFRGEASEGDAFRIADRYCQDEGKVALAGTARSGDRTVGREFLCRPAPEIGTGVTFEASRQAR